MIRWFRRNDDNSTTELHDFTDPTQPWLDCGEKHVDRRQTGVYTVTTEFTQFVDDALYPECRLWVNIVTGPWGGIFGDSMSFHSTYEEAITGRDMLIDVHSKYAVIDSLFRQNALDIQRISGAHLVLTAEARKLVQP